MLQTELHQLFKDFDLQITDLEIDMLYEIANHKKFTIAEGIHTCFLIGLSTLLYQIRRETEASGCCGDSG